MAVWPSTRRHSSTCAATEAMESRSWKCVAILSCLLALTLAKEPQLKLEDIERDTLTSENFQQQQLQQSQQQQRQTIQQLPPRPYFATATPAPPPPPPPPQVPQGPPEASTGPHQFSPEARQFPPPPPLQLQFPSRAPQQQIVSVPVFYQQPQGHDQQFQFQYLPDNSLQSQDPYNIQNYFSSPSTPQYVYIQQPSQQSTNTIPVNNKQGGIEYVQYIDPNTEILNNPQTQAIFANYKHKANHNLAGLIQRTAHTNVLPLNYRQPAPQSYRVQGMAQPLVNQNVYVIPPPQPLQQPTQPTNQLHALYQRTNQNNQVLAQQRFLVPQQPQQPQPQFQQQQRFQQFPGLTYAQPQRQQRPFYEQQQTQQSIANVVYEKREPQSLLDSYVPSVLQIQYYKELERQQQQQQQQANAIQQDGKLTEVVGKTDVVKPQENDFQFQ